jgi:hypothetical protein
MSSTEQTGLPASLAGAASATWVQTHRRCARLNYQLYRCAQVMGRRRVVQYGYARRDGELRLTESTVSVAQLASRVRGLRRWVDRRRTEAVARHRGREPGDATNTRTPGSRRGARQATGTGSRAGPGGSEDDGESDEPAGGRLWTAQGCDCAAPDPIAGGEWRVRCAECGGLVEVVEYDRSYWTRAAR